MKARAPGKLVLSGAYAVLQGAPAIVSAVDRFVEADTSRPAERVTPEVAAALEGEAAPYFDASALREGPYKLGLGSSAAILVASLAALALARRGESAAGSLPLSDRELESAVLLPALAAHARAQGGGSGIDVAAAARGGTLVFTRGADAPELRSVTLPAGLRIETWWSGEPAVTASLVGLVRALGARDAAQHAALLGAQADASHAAARAVAAGDAAGFIAALAAQGRALRALGDAAGANIVTAAAAALAAEAEQERATALPSGAGGGDVLIFVGLAPSSPRFRELAARHSHRLVPLALGARGVHALGEGSPS
jgi:phosphomevalonate kinase